MTIEITILLSILSVSVAACVATYNIRRSNKQDVKTEASEMTTVIVKLENISNGISEIKADMNGVKEDVKDLRDKYARLDESNKQAHKRIDEMKKE